MAIMEQRWWKLVAVVVVVAAVITAARILPTRVWLEVLNGWMVDAGAIGWLAFFLVYVAAAVLFVPGSVLTIGAGFAFGLAVGVPLVFVSATAGAAAAYLVSRYLARDWVRRQLGTGRKFRAVDQAVAREGWKIVFMLRLSPVFPYNALNYLLGLTGISFWRYVAASAFGMVPGTLLYVYIGYAGRAGLETAAGGGSGHALRLAYTAIGLVVTGFVTYYMTKIARRALRQQAGIEMSAAGKSSNGE